MQNNDNQTIKNDPNNRGQNEVESISPELSSIWLGRRDSNPRMPGPKPGALPLGHVPIYNRLILAHLGGLFNGYGRLLVAVF